MLIIKQLLDLILFCESFVKEIFTESDKELIPITQQTREVCKVSTQAEDSKIDIKGISSLEAHMTVLKLS